MILKPLKGVIYFLISVAALMPLIASAQECGGKAKCIFVLGNSITRHGPSAGIDWVGNWGMAATTAENDYVTQLVKLLTDKSSGEIWSADVQSGGVLETTPEKFKPSDSAIRLAQKADVVVVELGDNFTLEGGNIAAFTNAYTRTLNALRPAHGELACVSTWWASAPKDKIIEQSCRGSGGTYVDISRLSKSPENVAGNQQSIVNKGVAAHPGDSGMKAIADRIFKSVRR